VYSQIRDAGLPPNSGAEADIARGPKRGPNAGIGQLMSAGLRTGGRDGSLQTQCSYGFPSYVPRRVAHCTKRPGRASGNDHPNEIGFADPLFLRLHVHLCWAGAPGLGAHDHSHVRPIAPRIGQTAFAGIDVRISMPFKLLPHMLRLRAPLAEIIFGHSILPNAQMA
jgi:hypothetical protein